MFENLKRGIEENGWVWCLFDEGNGRIAWATYVLRIGILLFSTAALMNALLRESL